VEIVSRKFKINKDLTRIMCTLHEDLYIFIIMPLSILIIMRNFSERAFTNSVYNEKFFRKGLYKFCL